MVFELFTKQKERKEIAKPTDKHNPVYDALESGLDEMERQGVDRVVLSVYEGEPDPNAFGAWNSGEDFNYYPFEMLNETEQRMMLDKKHYGVISLVRDNVGVVVAYLGRGIERYDRTRVHPMLPAMKPESNINYFTQGCVYTGNRLKEFAEESAIAGWTPEMIEKRVGIGIQEYHDITQKLMEKAGVYVSLERLNKRGCSAFDEVMRNSGE